MDKPLDFYVRVSFSNQQGILENGIYIRESEDLEAKLCQREDYVISDEEER